jgi:hypothetical protein
MKKLLVLFLLAPFLLIPTKDDVQCPNNGPVYIKILNGQIYITCEVTK